MNESPESEAEVERLLVAIRPVPSDEFVDRAERRLLGRQPRRNRPRTLIAALAVSGALAITILVASLVGSGPLAPDGDTEVRAKDNCTAVEVTRTQPVGELVQGPDGKPRVVSTPRPVTTNERRCR